MSSAEEKPLDDFAHIPNLSEDGSNLAEILAFPEIQAAIGCLAEKPRKETLIKRMTAQAILRDRGLNEKGKPDDHKPGPKKLVGAEDTYTQGLPAVAADPSVQDWKNLPVSPEVEANAIAGLLQHPESRDAIFETLKPDHFHVTAHRFVMRAITELHHDGPFDVALLVAHLSKNKTLSLVGGADAVEILWRRHSNPSLLKNQANHLIQLAHQRDTIVTLRASLRDAEKGVTSKEIANKVSDLVNRIDYASNEKPSHFQSWPAPPGQAAWKGVAGEIVEAISPLTEADPVAILAQFLVSFGSLIGRGAHWKVEATRHHTNLFTCLVGQSGRGRKGTAWRIVQELLSEYDPEWFNGCVMSGLSSGEGLIKSVCDQNLEGGEYGVEDKRALWVESEFGGTLAMMGRESNSLSNFLRKAWDGDSLRTATKNSPLTSTSPHISLIGHTTFHDLGVNLSDNNLHNGLGNRILWVCTRRARELPEGGDLLSVNLDNFRVQVGKAVKKGRSRERAKNPMEFEPKARDLWREAYPHITRVRPGKLGPITDRAEAQIRRIAVVYALLDCSTEVKLPHLESAIAFWDYCERSAIYIFGDSIGSPDVQKLYQAILESGKEGLSLTAIKRTVFANRKTADQYRPLLEGLIRSGQVAEIQSPTNPDVRMFVGTAYSRSAPFAPSYKRHGINPMPDKEL